MQGERIGVEIADLLDARQHVGSLERQRVRILGVGNLVPRERCRHRRPVTEAQ